MRFNRRTVIAALAGLVLVSAVAMGWNWHYRRHVWPKEIQAGVLGAQVVGSDELTTSEGFSAYGEGVFRWTYRISAADRTSLAQYCKGQELSDCRFSMSRQLNDGVFQSVTYRHGMLPVEEVWK